MPLPVVVARHAIAFASIGVKTAELDYFLPEELIAQHPAPRRDDARLMVVDRARHSVAHHRFRDLPDLLRPDDLLVRNIARVLPARIFGVRSSGGRVECLLLRPDGSRTNAWWTLLRPGRRLRAGTVFGQRDEYSARVIAKSPDAEYLVEFEPARPGESVSCLAERLGAMPLPPYIRRENQGAGADGAEDRERYQTVFADPRHAVAVAAPTAGLHFTPELLARLRESGIEFSDVVLHVGLGTFRPIETEDVADHPMHRERVEIGPETQRELHRTRRGRRIAVGTTSVRAIESWARSEQAAQSRPEPYLTEADLFIRPPFEFRLTEALITNFHLPRSSLLCLVAAFLAPGRSDGLDWLKEVYALAVRERYRFLSYGDAMLIL